MTKVCCWLRVAICMVLLSVTIGLSGCAWLKAGEPLGNDPVVQDGRDAAEIDVDDPINPDDSKPSPGALP
ncbi:MAG: hypothetical protein RBS57_18645 [Desulforhabdus sp.]|nr:hypothetical protein [Desulforhabdus sp.]